MTPSKPWPFLAGRPGPIDWDVCGESTMPVPVAVVDNQQPKGQTGGDLPHTTQVEGNKRTS